MGVSIFPVASLPFFPSREASACDTDLRQNLTGMPKKFSIHISPIVRPRSSQDTHSFQRLRSFYLSPSPTKAQFDIASLSPPPGASTNPSPTSAHFPLGISPRTNITVGDNSSERTLRAVRSTDSMTQAKYSSFSKILPVHDAEKGGGTPRKTWMGIRRPRKTRCRGTLIMVCVVVLSMFLVMCLSLAFIGGSSGDGPFKKELNRVARSDPGVSTIVPVASIC